MAWGIGIDIARLIDLDVGNCSSANVGELDDPINMYKNSSTDLLGI